RHFPLLLLSCVAGRKAAIVLAGSETPCTKSAAAARTLFGSTPFPATCRARSLFLLHPRRDLRPASEIARWPAFSRCRPPAVRKQCRNRRGSEIFSGCSRAALHCPASHTTRTLGAGPQAMLVSNCHIALDIFRESSCIKTGCHCAARGAVESPH